MINYSTFPLVPLVRQERLETVTILTKDSSAQDLKDIHDRQPVFLSDEQCVAWLGDTRPIKEFLFACFHSLSFSYLN